MRWVILSLSVSLLTSTDCFSQQYDDPSNWRMVPSPTLPSHVQAFEFQNAAGELRYVAKSEQANARTDGERPAQRDFVKLYLSKEDLAADAPTGSYPKSNSFSKSCGPDSVYNLLRWHGVTKLDGTISVQSLGNQMKTNSWSLNPTHEWFVFEPRSAAVFKGSVELTKRLGMLTGTLPRPLAEVANRYTIQHLPDFSFLTLHGDRDEEAFSFIRMVLRSGNPLIVLYKTGTRKAHFALLVGYEQKAIANTFHNSDLFFLANPRKTGSHDEITWRDFKQRWDFSFGFASPVVREAGGKPRMRFAIVPKRLTVNWKPRAGTTAIDDGVLIQQP